jgi:hypothetical protein
MPRWRIMRASTSTPGTRIPTDRVVLSAAMSATAIQWRFLRDAHTAPAPRAMNRPSE